MNSKLTKRSNTFLSDKSRTFLLENNYNLLLLLEDAAQPESSPQIESVNSDDEPDYKSSDTNEANPDKENNSEETPDQEVQLPQTPEELQDYLNQNIDSADQKFIQFRLYDKIVFLMNMLTTLKNSSTLNIDEIEIINNFYDYSIILNELIFVMDINAIYQLIGQIEIDLESFLQTVNNRIQTDYQNYQNKIQQKG
jgi:hypothetical protein